MDSPKELREWAERYRHLASWATDPQAVKASCELATRYEALAAKLDGAGPALDQNSLPPRDIG